MRPRNARRAAVAVNNFHRETDGKIAFVAIPWVLGLVVLIGLLGNAGRAVQEKLEVQNAADATAHNAALWQARGLNALTTSNHLMGEFTALIVIHEALGGPELDDGDAITTDEDTDFRDKLTRYKDDDIPGAIHLGDGDGTGIGSQNTFAAFRTYDERIVNEVVGPMIDDDMFAGATIYDGRMNLKACAVLLLWIKANANKVALVGTAMKISGIPIIAQIGIALEAVAFGVHVAATAELVIIGKEWLVLRVHEIAGQATVPVKQTMREAIIPALSTYGDLVAGQAGLSPVNLAVSKTINKTRGSEKLAELVLFPPPDAVSSNRLRLPVVAEPAPPGGNASKPDSLWSGEDSFRGAMAPILALKEGFDATIGRVGTVLRVADALQEFLEPADPVDMSLNLEGFEEMTLFQDKNWPDNPSFTDSLPEFDWQAERTSQWSRATYPYVHSFRRSIREPWREGEPWSLTGVPTSMAPQYFAHWTNRYTVTESNRLRKAGSHLYTLADMQPTQKGQEPWTTEDRRAEQLFTVFASARRARRAPSFMPRLFEAADRNDTAAIAQAIVYNANGRELLGDPARQPNTGWDTLNWQPPVEAPEWGDVAPGEGDGRLLFEVLAGSSPFSIRQSQVRLNWQAKLVPITRTRLEDALGGQLSGAMKTPVGKVRDHFPIVTH